MKRFEYKEPEFNVVVADAQDVLTTSTPTPGGSNFTTPITPG